MALSLVRIDSVELVLQVADGFDTAVLSQCCRRNGFPDICAAVKFS